MRRTLFASICGTFLLGAPLLAQPFTPPAPKIVDKMLPARLGAPEFSEPGLSSDDASAYFAATGSTRRFWATSEYLLWTTSGLNAPPLVTSGAEGTPIAAAGVLGQPGTRTLIGNEGLNDNWRSGARLTLGGWFTCENRTGMEASFFWLQPGETTYTNGSTGTPLLARPFFNAAIGTQDSQLIAFPGVISGGIDIRSSTEFWGAEANLRHLLHCGSNWRVEGLVGYRYLNLLDNLSINQSALAGPQGLAPPGTTFDINDSFHTRNQFHGGQIGLTGKYACGRFSIDVTGKFAAGATRQEVDITGMTTAVVPGAAAIAQSGGLLALPSNIGSYGQTRFTVVPEAALRMKYQICSNVGITVGYSVMYWNSVARAGEQIDTTINSTQIPFGGPVLGSIRPLYLDRQSSFWAHGGTVGIEFTY